jgi:hypothetical protein
MKKIFISIVFIILFIYSVLSTFAISNYLSRHQNGEFGLPLQPDYRIFSFVGFSEFILDPMAKVTRKLNFQFYQLITSNNSIKFKETILVNLKVENLNVDKLTKATIQLLPPKASLTAFNKDFIIITRSGEGFLLRNNDKNGLASIKVLNLPQIAKSQSDFDFLRGFNEFGSLGVRDVKSIKVLGNDYLLVSYFSLGNQNNCPVMSIYISNEIEISSLDRLIFKKIYDTGSCLPLPIKIHPLGVGGRIIQLSESKILITLGEIAAPESVLIRSNDVWGTIQEIDLANFPNSIRSNQFASGFRNPAGITVTGQDVSKIVEVEQGPFGGDEINLITRNSDYGWPNYSLGTNYSSGEGGARLSNSESPAGESLLTFLPSPAFSDVDVAPTRFIPEWKNNYGIPDILITSLKGNSIYRCRITNKDFHIKYCEQIDLGERLRDIAVSSEGEIAILTDDAEIKILTRNN